MRKHILTVCLLSGCIDAGASNTVIDGVGGLPARLMQPSTASFAAPEYLQALRTVADAPENRETDVFIGAQTVRIAFSAPRLNGLGNICRNYRAQVLPAASAGRWLPDVPPATDTGRLCRVEGMPWAVHRDARF